MAEINSKMVGDLRSRTGAGLMDCKKALVEAEGDVDKAIDILRAKGVASAAKKAGRDASEGIIEQYIHLGGKVGVLLELNCETDFVAKTDDFKALAKDICMHVAAAAPLVVNREDVPEDILEKERAVAAEQVKDKPAHVIQKIVEGKLDKYYQSVALMEQPFVKDTEKSIKDLLSESVSKLGENLVIKRFARFQIGE